MKPEIDAYELLLNNTKYITISEDIFSAICFGAVMLAKYTK